MSRRKDDYIFGTKQKRSRGLGLLITAALLVISLTVASLIYNKASNERIQLIKTNVTVMSLDKSYEGFRVLHISDLHASPLGGDLTLWRNLLYGESYDAAVLTGDMVGQSGEYEPLVSLIHNLSLINKNAPIYFIAGDDDPPPVLSSRHGSPEVMANWVLAAQQEGAVYLDSLVSQQAGKKTVWFVPVMLYDTDIDGMLGSLQTQKAGMEALGQQYEADSGATYRYLCYYLEVMQRTAEALAGMKADDMQIAVSHVPLETDYIRQSLNASDRDEVFGFRGVNLILAGHYCGGQWRLPGLGPIYVPELGWFPADETILGLRRINSINQYVSGGIGSSGLYPMQGRLFNAPSATIVKFTARLQ